MPDQSDQFDQSDEQAGNQRIEDAIQLLHKRIDEVEAKLSLLEEMGNANQQAIRDLNAAIAPLVNKQSR
jgi:uncharacterized protein YigA (DUF484 family)